MPRPDDATYVIRTGAAALDRLELIARLFWPTTEAFLARNDLPEAARFVDVGCGIGDVASRLGAAGIRRARRRRERRGRGCSRRPHVHPRQSRDLSRRCALAQVGVDDDLCGFDAVYARCVLSHQSDPRAGLAAMVAAARPGGRILVEDVEVAAIWSSPPDDALVRHVELYVAAAHGLGARPDIGCELAPMLTELGASDVRVDLVQPVLREPADLEAHARTMEAISAPVVEQGLAEESEVAELVARLDAFAATPGVVATLPRIIQVSARGADLGRVASFRYGLVPYRSAHPHDAAGSSRCSGASPIPRSSTAGAG